MEVEYDWQNDQSGMHQSKVFFISNTLWAGEIIR